MKAAILTAPEKIEIYDIPQPLPAPGEVLVKILKAGICGSDYSKFLGHLGGPYGIVPGHEATGEVTALGAGVPEGLLGKLVAIQPNFPCRKCGVCLSGRENICPAKIRLGIDVNGVFAEYVCAPFQNVWPLPREISDAEGVLVEPLAVALHGYNKALPLPGERVLIYGAGVIGLFFVRLAALAQARVAALDLAEPRLQTAQKLGALELFSSIDQMEKDSFSVIYEASGSPDALAQIIPLCAPGAKIVLTGLPKDTSNLATSSIVRKELTITGSMIYIDEFPGVINLLAEGVMEAGLFLSDPIPLERLEQTLLDFRSPFRVKDVISLT